MSNSKHPDRKIRRARDQWVEKGEREYFKRLHALQEELKICGMPVTMKDDESGKIVRLPNYRAIIELYHWDDIKDEHEEFEKKLKKMQEFQTKKTLNYKKASLWTRLINSL